MSRTMEAEIRKREPEKFKKITRKSQENHKKITRKSR